jgi:hypothetical protein
LVARCAKLKLFSKGLNKKGRRKMLVTVRNNDNTETTYSFEPATSRATALEMFYSNLYKTLQIQGFKVEDETGKILSFRGSI